MPSSSFLEFFILLPFFTFISYGLTSSLVSYQVRKINEVSFLNSSAPSRFAALISILFLSLTYFSVTAFPLSMLSSFLFMAVVAVWISLWVAMAYTDYKTTLVDDILAYPLILSSLAISYLAFQVDFDAIFFVLFVIFLIKVIYEPIRGLIIMGAGDIVPLLASVVLFGRMGMVSVVLVAVVTALFSMMFVNYINRGREEKLDGVPFLPFLAFGNFMTLLPWLI